MRPKVGPLALLMATCLSFSQIETSAKRPPPRPPQQHPAVKVVSVTGDAAGTFVLLSTLNHKQLPAPVINYLPGNDGTAIMSADFPGTILCARAETFRFTQTQFSQLHVGQLQASPPVVRIAIEGKRAANFRRIDFRSTNGSLIIKLPSDVIPAKAAAPRVVPPVHYISAESKPAPMTTVQSSPKPAPMTTVQSPPKPPPMTTVQSSPKPAPMTTMQSSPKPAPMTTVQSSPKPAPERTLATAKNPKPAQTIVMPLTAPTTDPNAPRLRGPIDMDDLQLVTNDGVPLRQATPQARSTPTEAPAAAAKPDKTDEQPKVISTGDASYTRLAEPSHIKGKLKKLLGFDKQTTDSAEDSDKTTPASSAKKQISTELSLVGNHDQKDSKNIPVPVKTAEKDKNKAAQDKQAKTAKTGLPDKQSESSKLSTTTMGRPGSDTSATIGAIDAQSQPLKVSLEGTDPISVKVSSTKPFQMNTFRLHEPERYVIDLMGIALNDANVEMPAPPDNPLVKSVRIGSPEGESSSVTRLVVDLSATDIAIADMTGKDGLSATFQIQHDGIQTATKPERIVPKRLSGYTVILDAGHGGSDPGAQRGDVQEKEITMSIVEKLRKQLESKGIRVKLTRSDDTFVSLEDRVRITNNIQPDCFVSVHINAMETNTATHGIETYFQNDRSKDLAELIHESLVKDLKAPDRSIRKARFYVINHTPLPAILAEVGFISNKDERDKLISSDYQTHIASALSDGVMLFLADRAQGRALGTISALPPSVAQQSFTQNLHSHNPPESPKKTPESRTRRANRVITTAEKGRTKLSRQSLKFNKNHLAKNHLASTRS